MGRKFRCFMNKKYGPQLVVFLTALLACLGLLIGNGVFPFGENCLLHVDMYHQYCPFFSEFLDKLKNHDSLLYSWNLGLGSDYVSLYVYYLASPLNWLLILWPKAYVIEFMEITIVLKMCISAVGFYMFVDKLYPVHGKDGKLQTSLFLPAYVTAFTYAFCGFVAAYNWDIMWMDCIALFPFVMLGLYRLVLEKKPGLYFVSLALCIWANYYISMMICMTLCVYFVYLFVKIREGRVASVFRFAWYSLLAGGLSAVLLLPEYFVLGYSGSQGINFPKTIEWYFGLIQELSRLNAFAYVYTGRDHWPNLYSGVFTILLVVLYFFNRRIKVRDKVFHFLLIAFFLMGFSNNQLDFIWHGFHFPDSLPGRQSFIFSFVLLVMAVEVLRKWKGIKVWHILASVALCTGCFVAGSIMTDEAITDWFSYLVTGIFLLAYAIMLFLIRMTPKDTRKFYRNIALVFALVEVIANMAATGFGVTSRTDYTAKFSDYEILLNQMKVKEIAESETGAYFYRVEDLERHTKNDDSYYGYPSATQFSSLMNINVSHFYQKVGMEGGKNFYCYNGATPLLTSMLSMKYMLSDDEISQGPLWEQVGQEGDARLYEYQYFLPLGFMLPSELRPYWSPKSSTDVDNINRLGSLLGATGDILESVDIVTKVSEGKTEFESVKAGYYFAQYGSYTGETLSLQKDTNKRNYAKASHGYLLDLGYCQENEAFSVTNRTSQSLNMTTYRVNEEQLKRAYDFLNKQTMTLIEKKSDMISGMIDVKEEGDFFLSIPSEPGWTLYVDGVKTEFESLEEAFIIVPLEEGSHMITLSYMSPGFMTGLYISCACLVLAVISFGVRLWINSLRKKENQIEIKSVS